MSRLFARLTRKRRRRTDMYADKVSTKTNNDLLVTAEAIRQIMICL